MTTGSSLCAFVPENKIKNYLGKDQMAQEALFVRKSTTWIRIDKNKKEKPQHIELIKFLNNNYYKVTENFVKNAIIKLSEKDIDDILNEVDDYISEDRKNLIRMFLKRKIEDLRKIYKEGD